MINISVSPVSVLLLGFIFMIFGIFIFKNLMEYEILKDELNQELEIERKKEVFERDYN